LCMSREKEITAGLPADVAVAALFRAYGDDMYGLGLKMCGHPADAEDLVQETFLRAYRDWPGYRGDSSPSTWLYAIAVRVCRRLHRRRVGEPSRFESLSRPAAAYGEGEGIAAPQGTPLDQVIDAEARTAVQKALSRLPLHYRLPLALKELTDFSIDEIAGLLDLRPATVRSRVHRGRIHLAREIQSGEETGESDCTRICRDLLETKQQALDDGKSIRLPAKSHCARCRSFLESLEIGQRACREMARAQVPDEIRRVLWREISAQG